MRRTHSGLWKVTFSQRSPSLLRSATVTSASTVAPPAKAPSTLNTRCTCSGNRSVTPRDGRAHRPLVVSRLVLVRRRPVRQCGHLEGGATTRFRKKFLIVQPRLDGQWQDRDARRLWLPMSLFLGSELKSALAARSTKSSTAPKRSKARDDGSMSRSASARGALRNPGGIFRDCSSLAWRG